MLFFENSKIDFKTLLCENATGFDVCNDGAVTFWRVYEFHFSGIVIWRTGLPLKGRETVLFESVINGSQVTFSAATERARYRNKINAFELIRSKTERVNQNTDH